MRNPYRDKIFFTEEGTYIYQDEAPYYDGRYDRRGYTIINPSDMDRKDDGQRQEEIWNKL